MLAPCNPSRRQPYRQAKPLIHSTIHLLHASLPALEVSHANTTAELSKATGKTQLLQATRTLPRADTAGGRLVWLVWRAHFKRELSNSREHSLFRKCSLNKVSF